MWSIVSKFRATVEDLKVVETTFFSPLPFNLEKRSLNYSAFLGYTQLKTGNKQIRISVSSWWILPTAVMD